MDEVTWAEVAMKGLGVIIAFATLWLLIDIYANDKKGRK